MLRNYYYLNRAVSELNKVLRNVLVTEIFSQDKNLLLLSIPTEELPYRHLVISTDPSLPYLLVKKEHRKARKNVIEITTVKLPNIISAFSIAENDRLIQINLDKVTLYFSMMGGKTNVYFVSDGKIIDQFKKGKTENDLLSRIAEHDFISEPVYHNIDKNVFTDFDMKKIRTAYSFISKEIKNELYIRNKNFEELEKDFRTILFEIYNNDINVFYNRSEDKVRFVPVSFKSFNEIDDTETFSNFNSALVNFISKFYTHNTIDKIEKEINKYLTKELEKLSSKLNNLRGRIDMGERSDEFYNLANLLSINRSELKKGIDKVTVQDISDGKDVLIKLNPKHSPQESIDYYFNKARDEKINFEKSMMLFKETEKKYNRLLEIKDRFEKAENKEELFKIKDELKITNKNKEKKKVNVNAKLKEYLLDNKYTVLIGRDSKSNDLLSTKIAKQNDYWFHARGLPGSHVVLRVDKPKEGVPKNILKNAAQLAAYHSKAKTAKLAPVSYTFGKYVRKKKGMDPGKVLLMKENVLLVKPEIPKNAVLVTDE